MGMHDDPAAVHADIKAIADHLITRNSILDQTTQLPELYPSV